VDICFCCFVVLVEIHLRRLFNQAKEIEIQMKSAVTRFRFMAYLAGLVLLAFTVEIIIKYTLGPEVPWFAQLHGLIYMVYLVVTFDLARNAKWGVVRTLGMCLAGTVPLMSFYAERWVVKQIPIN
jgi:integral membrane protein